MRALMPGLQCLGFRTKRCVLTRTPSGKQYIGSIPSWAVHGLHGAAVPSAATEACDVSGVFVATGGNGYSAMCSDALGSVAAHVAANDGAFPEGYDAAEFLPRFNDEEGEMGR